MGETSSAICDRSWAPLPGAGGGTGTATPLVWHCTAGLHPPRPRDAVRYVHPLFVMLGEEKVRARENLGRQRG